MNFLYLLVGLIALVCNFMIAGEFAGIADKKGYNGTKYGLYTFFFGIVGMLMVVALPPVHQSGAKTASTNNHQKKAIITQNSLHVQTDEDFIDIKCPNCGETLSVLPGEDAITCPWCDTPLKL